MSAPRKASTLLLLRDGPEGLEVFMVRRHSQSDFVGGAYVFPGGAVDHEDVIDHAFCAGITDAQASGILGVTDGGLAYWVAAIRECFEEAGVLLAYDSTGELIDFDRAARAEQFKKYRSSLNAGDLSLADLLRREGLKLATDRVHYWAHWITPEARPRRYDTRFFLALTPQGQSALHDGRELTESSWVTPCRALERAGSGEWTVILPTIRNLKRLSRFSSAAAAASAAAAQGVVPTMTPQIIQDGSGARIIVPEDDADDGYCGDENPVPEPGGSQDTSPRNDDSNSR